MEQIQGKFLAKDPISSQIRPPKGRQFVNKNAPNPAKLYDENMQKQFDPLTVDNVWEKSKNKKPKYVSLRNTFATP